MTSGQDPGATTPDESAPVKLALEQSQEVKAKVEECAEDIGANNAAVQSKIADGATTLSAPKALAEGRKVESKIQEVADDLHNVTETLAQGVEELRQLEVDLSASRAALAESDAALAISTEAEKESRHRSLHDATTGLPNRNLFGNRLEQAISMAKRHRWSLAVLFLDLDRFKDINDTYGHTVGDVVLKEVANRLSGDAREEDTVCRNGGDEFLYLLVNPQGRENTERIVRSIIPRISRPISVGRLELAVQASIGIAVYPDTARTPAELIAQADAAMYEAKRSRTGYAFAEVFGSERAAA